MLLRQWNALTRGDQAALHSMEEIDVVDRYFWEYETSLPGIGFDARDKVPTTALLAM